MLLRLLTAAALMTSLAPARAASPMPYKTVSEALAALSAKDGAIKTEADGWITVTEPLEGLQWSFVPGSHGAYPSLVRRSIVRPPGEPARVEMATICEAPASACAALAQEFEAQNSRFEQYVRSRARKPPPGGAPAAP
ncbi:hypothetical protein [Aquariibacter albus]|uniref:Molecular chaperone DnaJ n=1 Tax=Aquariibacter albus TaxID=2759899 RepID=A0A839HSL9_9BURK|nr:hypothetical protein [Aquariibacter albus]MBB1162161.1 hypothetical protein [Aquariibacter albus]